MIWEPVAAAAAVVVPTVGAVYHAAARKLDQIGEHLTAQDVQHTRMAERVSRIEGKLEIEPVVPAP